MKKANRNLNFDSAEMSPEYDFSRGIRGKYASKVGPQSRVILLSSDTGRKTAISRSIKAKLREIKTKVAELDALINQEAETVERGKRHRK